VVQKSLYSEKEEGTAFCLTESGLWINAVDGFIEKSNKGERGRRGKGKQKIKSLEKKSAFGGKEKIIFRLQCGKRVQKKEGNPALNKRVQGNAKKGHKGFPKKGGSPLCHRGKGFLENRRKECTPEKGTGKKTLCQWGEEVNEKILRGGGSVT